MSVLLLISYVRHDRELKGIHQDLEKLGQAQFTQSNIDNIYANFCDTVKMEMDVKGLG